MSFCFSPLFKSILKGTPKISHSILMMLFLTTFSGTLFADAPAQGLNAAGFANWGFIIVFFLIFYFLIMRPQQKRAKEHRDLIMGLQKGDEVLTNGGLLGKISRVTDHFFIVTIAEGVDVTVQKQAIAGSMPKGTLRKEAQ